MHGYGIASWIESATGDVLRVEEGSLYPALFGANTALFSVLKAVLFDPIRRATRVDPITALRQGVCANPAIARARVYCAAADGWHQRTFERGALSEQPAARQTAAARALSGPTPIAGTGGCPGAARRWGRSGATRARESTAS